jgi:HlyD family secretion protein
MRRIIIISIILIVFVGGFFGFRQFQQTRQAQAAGAFQTEAAQTGSLTATVGATGIVRSNQSATIVWQTSGTVEEVMALISERVSKGDELAALAQTSLPQNVILAQAELVSAEKALDDLVNSSLPQAQAQQAVEDAQEALDLFLVNFAMQQSQAGIALANAQDALDDAEYYWRSQQAGNRASGDVINAAEANLLLADSEVDKAQREYNKYSGRDDDDPLRALALSNLSAARQQRDAILRQLNWYTGEPTELDQALLDARVAAAEAQLAEAQAAWDLLVAGPSEADIQLLEAQLAEAVRAFERVENGVNPEDVKAAEARVAAAQATLDFAHLTAPFDGTVTAVESKPGDQVTPGTIAFRLDDLSRLLVDVEVSEVDINRLSIGQPAILTFDAVLDKEYEGVVTEVGLIGNTLQGAVNFRVTIELTNPDDQVRSGMTAAVNMVVEELDNVLLVPNRAVRIREGNRVVFVLRDGVAEPVPIVLGASSDLVSEVASGDLEVGDPVILNPPAESFFGGGPPGGGGPPNRNFGG